MDVITQREMVVKLMILAQQWNKCAHLTNNAKCNFVEWKTRYATTWGASYFLQMRMQSFLNEHMTIIQ